MSYVLEQDLVRPELLTGGAGVIEIWPKINGRNVQVTAAGGKVYRPDGTEMQTLTTALVDVTLGSRTVSRIDCTVAAIDTPDEDYQLAVQWTFGGQAYDDAITFDVCLRPLGSLISYAKLLAMQPGLGDSLDRLGQRLGYTAGQEAKEYAAGVYIVEARQRLQARLQARAREEDRVRPHMLLDRRAVGAYERMLAMISLYEALGGTNDELDDSAAAQQVRHWTRRANAAWADLRIKFMAHNATTSAPESETDNDRAFTMERA